jgi:nicotinate-nucleotide adenylyltransferase
MLKVGVADFDGVIEVDDIEIQRGGKSYSVDTIANYAERYGPENIYLILGIDTFEEFDKWLDFTKIIKLANLIVTTRPGNNLPFSISDFPEGLQKYIDQFDKGFAYLVTGRTIEIVRLADVDVSSSQIRKKIRAGKSAERYLSFPVEKFIQERGLYRVHGDRIGDYEALVRQCCDLLVEKKAVRVRAFDLRGYDAASDFTVIASGTSTRHVISLADQVTAWIKEEFGVLPYGLEGKSEGRWVLVDYGAVVMHIFYDFVRQQYNLEELWNKGKEIKLLTPE